MSRADRFDRADFRADLEPQPAEPSTDPSPARQEAPTGSAKPIWPIADVKSATIGSSVMPDRNGRPHKGVDLFTSAGAQVLASMGGQVLRVVDGRKSQRSLLRRAGLFVDVRGSDSLLYRYLHLGAASVLPGAAIAQGAVVGTVAAAHTSGLGEAPHLHFEIRRSDYNGRDRDYGSPINPLRLLPPIQS